MIAAVLFWLEERGASLFAALGAPVWLTGLAWHGIWRGLAWVVSVMLPPMAIFFPLFTVLENLGYDPLPFFEEPGRQRPIVFPWFNGAAT